jgi:flagellin
MALVVNTNIASLTAQNYATASRKDMETAMERLSSGQRINSAADDAAGLAISTRLEAQIRGLTKGIQNANDAISIAQTAEGAQAEITSLLQRMRELAVQSANSSNNAADRNALDAEVQQLIAEVDQIASNTMFNGQTLLDGSFEANIQMGPNVANQLGFSIESMKAVDLGLGAGSAASGSSVISGRTSIAAVDAGDIMINGQSFGAITATMDLSDVATLINDSVDNVEASAFNEVTMQHVGTGISTAGQIVVDVVPVNSSTTALGTTVTATLGATASLQEVADEINAQLGSYVTASINADGKLTLRNDTGASIEITDTSTGNAATGVGSSEDGVAFAGFLKLTSTDGSDVRVEKAFTSSNIGTDADLATLGFRENGEDNSPENANQIQGVALTDTTTAWGSGDIKINGVDVYDADIATTSFDGKLNAINAKSSETGVVASAYFEKLVDISAAVGTDASSDGDYTINGVAITALDATVTAAEILAAINDVKSSTGITAELAGDYIKLSGNVSSVTLAAAGTATADVFGTGASTSSTSYAGIKLDSLNDGAISIDLGESATVAEHGFLEANVGAADYDTNDPSAFSGGTSLTGVSVSSVSSSQAALTAIDNALQTVSDSASSLGAIQNRLDHAIANMQETVVNTEASKSRIMDADFAVESARLAKQQVLQQASTAMLAQANASTQSVLTLLGG